MLAFFHLSACPSIYGQRHQYLEAGDQALLQKNYKAAVSNYLKGMTFSEKNDIAQIWDDLGFAYLQERKYQDAGNYLQEAISAFPEDFNSRLYLAASLYLLNDIPGTERELNKIEKNIYFDEGWHRQAQNMSIVNEQHNPVFPYDLEKIRREKGISLRIIPENGPKQNQAVLYIDAFNDSNQGIFHFLQGLVCRERGDSIMEKKYFSAAREAGYEEAEFKVERIQHRLSNHATALLSESIEQFLEAIKRGQIQDAINTLEEALQVNEKSYAVNYNLSLLYFDEYQMDGEDAEKLDKAAIYCARALWYRDSQPVTKDDLIGGFDLMGHIFSIRQEYVNSIREYRQILEIDRENLHAYYNLGVEFYNLRDYIQAESQWKKILEFESTFKTSTERQDKEKQELRHSVTVKKLPIIFLAHQSLGNLYLNQQNWKKAAAELEAAIRLQENAAEPHLVLAKAYIKLNTDEKAVFHLERYLFLGGKDEKQARFLLDQVKRR